MSNLGSEGIVAAMTVFVHGRPLQRDYRKFKMKEIDGPDDYGSMREAVGRRFQRLMDGDLKFCEVPDLLLIDGGSVHAAAARDTLRELGLELPVYGMVKDDKHRTRAAHLAGRGGDRHQRQSGCVRPHRHDTGGDA